ncbi:MAG: MBL fold metallo-hydrolase [Oceanospirillaceae bacterium]|nr:MBL fold metallo-hydrolase [Oceanospirillaceae bacterium]
MGATESLREHYARKQRDRQALDYPFSTPEVILTKPVQVESVQTESVQAGPAKAKIAQNKSVDEAILLGKQLIEVARGVFWLRMPMPMALDHINVYLLQDDDGWYLVDTGLNTSHVRAIWQRVGAEVFNHLPVKGIICTHFHYDHASLSSWLMEYFSAPLYMTYGEYFTQRALAASRQDVGSEQQKQFYLSCGMDKKLVNEMLTACRDDPFMGHYPNRFIRIREHDVFHIQGRKWQVVIGEGHSPEHACLYCEQDALLIAGDQLLPEISSNVLVSDVEPESDPLSNWFSSLDKLSQLKADTLVLPSHGPVFKNLHARVDQLREHHHDQLDLVRSKASLLSEAYKGNSEAYKGNTNRNGFTAYQALNWMFDRKLSPIESMLAQGETLAHLNWMHWQGELEYSDEPDGIRRYRFTKTNTIRNTGEGS